jgi:hypothetical protein
MISNYLDVFGCGSRYLVDANSINDHNYILKRVTPIVREAHTGVALLKA